MSIRPIMGEALTVRSIIIRSGRMLLLQRSTLNRYNAGKWEFPGGKLEFGLNLDAELRREVSEETGYELGKLRYLGYRAAKEALRGGRRASADLSIMVAAYIKKGSFQISSEHADYQWCTLTEAKSLSLTPRTLDALTKYGSLLKREYKLQI